MGEKKDKCRERGRREEKKKLGMEIKRGRMSSNRYRKEGK